MSNKTTITSYCLVSSICSTKYSFVHPPRSRPRKRQMPDALSRTDQQYPQSPPKKRARNTPSGPLAYLSHSSQDRIFYQSTKYSLQNRQLCIQYLISQNYIIFTNQADIFITYDHRTSTIALPVRSAVLKRCTGGLVVRWVTTGESPLLYVFAFCLSDRLYCRDIILIDVFPSTYNHRTLKARLPVRSALVNQCIGGLVVRWVTTGEYPLLYVFAIFVY